MEYLKLTKDYAINPFDRAFALLGTQHHRRLEIIANKLKDLEAEKKLIDETNSGILDLLEPDYDDYWIMSDYKTWGSYMVQLVLDKTSYERYSASLQLNDYRMKA
jgi:hypothetical protein